MPDSSIGLPLDGPGKKVDTESVTTGAGAVERERHQFAGAGATEICRVLSSDPASADHGLVTRESALVSPQDSEATVATVAAGSTGSVDSTQLSSGVTGKLLSFEADGSAAFKVELQTVLNGVPTTRITKISRGGQGVSWKTPHKDLISQAESATAGFDGFRLLFTNLDTGSGSTDFHGSFLWDEV